MGDAVRFANDQDYKQGLCFAGRVSEEFKLQSGTWVSAGTLRAEAVTAASPYIRDVVVCGLNQHNIALLIWPNLNVCSALAEKEYTGKVSAEEIVRSPAVIEAIALGLQQHNKANSGLSKRVARFLLMALPPDPGAYEITDKGYVNQAEVQKRRELEVNRLYADKPDESVITLVDT